MKKNARLAVLFAALILTAATPAPGRKYPRTPADLQPPLAYHRLVVVTPDSARLAAWYVPAQDSLGAVSSGRHPGLLLLPDNDDTMDRRLSMVSAMARRGFAVLTFDHRGRGESSPYAADPNILVPPPYLDDAHAGLDALWTRSGVDTTRVAVYGHSRGAWLALALAGARPEVRAVAAASVPYNGKEWLAAEALRFPDRPLHLPRRWKRRNDPDRVIRRFNGAILFITGDRDAVTPTWMATRLHDRYPRAKDLWIVKGAAHSGARSPEAVKGEAYYGRVAAFLQRELARKPHRGWPHR